MTAGLAVELTGLSDRDPQAGQWVVRLVLSLLFWPGPDAEAELEMLRRLVTPAFAGSE
jgi:hypothetical protein